MTPRLGARFVMFVCLVTILVASGRLALVNAAPGDDTATGPEATSSSPLVPITVRPTETPVPTREPRATVTPAGVPTEVPRVTPTPTEEAIDPHPPVTVSPTEEPVGPPTGDAPDPMPNPPGGDDQPSNIPPLYQPVFGSAIVHTARVCPVAIDPAPDLDLLESACTAVPQKTLFRIWPSVMSSSTAAGFDHNGAGVKFNVSPGSYQSVMVPIDGFQLLGVGCATTPPRTEAQPVGFSAQNNPPTTTITYTITVAAKFNKTTKCTWYLHTSQETANIEAHVWQCPSGYDLLTAVSPATDCTVPYDGAPGLAYRTGGGTIMLNRTSGADGPGMALFHDLPTLYDWRISFTLPGASVYDYLDAMSCGGGSLVHDGLTTLTLSPGATVVCHWYIVPEEPGAYTAPHTISATFPSRRSEFL